MATRILTLDTLVERPVVCVDNADYSLKTADDFGLAELAKIQRMQTDLTSVMTQADLTPEEIERLARILDDMTALVLPEMPADVRDRLRDGQKLAIIRAFQGATETQHPVGTLPPQSPPTGAN